MPPSFRFPSSVWVAVTGMSPAVLTETVWALAHERPRVRPARIVTFGATRSREAIRRELLASGVSCWRSAVWGGLRRALKAGPEELLRWDGAEHLRVYTLRGRELVDIVSPEENAAAAADCLLEHLRAFEENPDLRVIASIAGGRKTMSALFFVPLRNRVRELDRMPGGYTRLVQHYARALKTGSRCRRSPGGVGGLECLRLAGGRCGGAAAAAGFTGRRVSAGAQRRRADV